jgi:hypothetical protein
MRFIEYVMGSAKVLHALASGLVALPIINIEAILPGSMSRFGYSLHQTVDAKLYERGDNPFELRLVDPAGRTVSRTESSIPGAVYVDSDFGVFTSTTEFVDLPLSEVLPGDYELQVIAGPGVGPDDAFTLVGMVGGSSASHVEILLENVSPGPNSTTSLFTPLPFVFVDGFETGDTSAWSAVVP